MPKEFTGSVEAPMDMQFGADSYVDSSNSLEGLEEGAKALSATTGYFVQKKLQNDLLAEDSVAAARDAELRRMKQKWSEAADRRDEEQVVKFGQQIEELTIAERQGAISGTNGQIRKESLLRSYINRFPHREEELRQTYSATRRMLQEGRAEKTNDPFEEAYDDIIKESVARGKTPIQVLEDRQKKDANDRLLQDIQVDVALGQTIAPKVEQNFDTNVLPRIHDTLYTTINFAYQASLNGANDIDVMNVKRQIEALHQGARFQVSKVMNDMVANSDEPGAILPPEFRNQQLKKIDDMFAGVMPYLDNIDSLKAIGRNLEHLKFRTMDELMHVDPMLRMLISIGAVDWAGKFLAEQYPAVATMAATTPGGVQAFIDNAPTEMERNRRKFQARMLGVDYSPTQRASDIGKVVESGQPPEQTGDPYVDAGRLMINTDPLLKSKDVPPEVKRNAGNAILEAEKREQTYLAPGAHWYKKREHLDLLRSSPEIATRMEEELANSVASVTRKISDSPKLSASLQFIPNLEADMQNHQKPWKAYTTGGPFTIEGAEDNPANVDFQEVGQVPVVGMMVPDDKVVLDTLNNMYWLVRALHGPVAAEDWAEQILSQRDADVQAAADAEAQAKADEDKPFDIPTVELTD